MAFKALDPTYQFLGVNLEYKRSHGQDKRANPYGRLSIFFSQDQEAPLGEVALSILPGLGQIMANEAHTNPPSDHRAHLQLLTNADTGIVSVLTDAGRTQEHSGNDGAIQRQITRIARQGLATVGGEDHEAGEQVAQLREELRQLTESTDKEKEDLNAEIQRLQQEHEQELVPLREALRHAEEQLQQVRLANTEQTNTIRDLEQRIEQLTHRIETVLPQEHQRQIDQLNHEHQLEMQQLAHTLEQTQLALDQAQARLRVCDGDGHADRSHASIIQAQRLRIEELEVIRRACQEGPQAHLTVIAGLREELQQVQADLLICQGNGEHESHQTQIQQLRARVQELEEAEEDLPLMEDIEDGDQAPRGTNWKRIGIYALTGAVVAGTVALAIFAGSKTGKKTPKSISPSRVVAATKKIPVNPLKVCGNAFGYAFSTVPGAAKYLGSKAISWFTASPKITEEAMRQASQLQ